MDEIRRMIAQLAGRFSPSGRRQSLYEQNVPTYGAGGGTYGDLPSLGGSSSYPRINMNRGYYPEEEDPLMAEAQLINRQYPPRTWGQEANPQMDNDRIEAMNQLRFGITPQPLTEQDTNPDGRRPFYSRPISGFYHPEMMFNQEDTMDRYNLRNNPLQKAMNNR